MTFHFKVDKENYLRNWNKFLIRVVLFWGPYYKDFYKESKIFSESEKYYNNCLSLPMFPTLTKDEQEYVMFEIDNFFNA